MIRYLKSRSRGFEFSLFYRRSRLDLIERVCCLAAENGGGQFLRDPTVSPTFRQDKLPMTRSGLSFKRAGNLRGHPAAVKPAWLRLG